MNDVKQVEGRDELIRDMSSKAVINLDQGAYQARKRQKELARQKELEKKEDKERIQNLEYKVDRLMEMLELLADKR